jgi:hypothetical protein
VPSGKSLQQEQDRVGVFKNKQPLSLAHFRPPRCAVCSWERTWSECGVATLVPDEEGPDLRALRLAVFYLSPGHGAVFLHANRLAQGEGLVRHIHVAVRETLYMDESVT